MVPGPRVFAARRSPLILCQDRRIRAPLPHGAEPPLIDLTRHRPDPRALDRIGIETALQLGVLPLQPAGAVTPVVTEGYRQFRDARAKLERTLGPVICARAHRDDIERRILALRAPTLAARAALRTPESVSCRNWSGRRMAVALAAILTAIALVALAWPGVLIAALTVWAALTLISVTGLRLFAAVVEARHARRVGQTWASQRPLRHPSGRQPSISLLVPLYDERDIAGRLVDRLARLDYPRDRLDVLLILEADDTRTQKALEDADLPNWMRIVEVPTGKVRTKPRAMNYALDFARGEIVGIYDAEDAPAADQLMKVADAFRSAGPDVACVQGVLDFYNARQSWLTRCFTIDYATWFRLVLPGMVRLGFVIPLGGTTVFFRRAALERLGRWDAHNVTEDADLGIRLARRGYRVAFINSVTEEEATASVPAWLRQRSRWIKGYAATWAVHMRDPLRLWGELGAMRFLGFQILFLGTLSQFVLAPFLWSFWLVLFGLPHPVTTIAPWSVILGLSAVFLVSEIATLAIAALSVATPKHRWLIKWVPVMHLYFPLAAIASWKGFAELITRPFFWDKTAHGRDATPRPADRAAPPLRRPGEAALRTRG